MDKGLFTCRMNCADGASRRPTIQQFKAHGQIVIETFSVFVRAAAFFVRIFTVCQPTNKMNKIIILILIRAREGYGNGIDGSCCCRCLMPFDWLHASAHGKNPRHKWQREKKGKKLFPSSSPSSSSSFKFDFQFILSFVQRFSFCCSIRISLNLNAKRFVFVAGSRSLIF